MIALAIISALVGSGLAFALGWSVGRKLAIVRKVRAQREIDEADNHVTILTEIRENRAPLALEYMEYATDSVVCRLWCQRNQLSLPMQTRVLKTLRMIRKYRQKWPREDKSDWYSSATGIQAEEVRSTAAEAKQILDEINIKNFPERVIVEKGEPGALK